MRSDDRSRRSKSGWFRSAIHTVGGQNSFVARSASTAASMPPGSAFGEQDVDGAEVDARREEAVQLRGVEERQRVDLDVVGRHLAVDEAAVCWAIRLRLVRIVPLGRDSVPLV